MLELAVANYCLAVVCCSQFEDEDDEGDDEVDEIVDTDDEEEESEEEARVLQGTNVDVDDGGEGGKPAAAGTGLLAAQQQVAGVSSCLQGSM